MSGDYLWDRSGRPDPDVVRLERVLGKLAEDPAKAKLLPFPSATPPRRRSVSFVVVLTSLAAAVVALIGFTWNQGLVSAPGLLVTTIEGTPTISSAPVGDHRELPAGKWLETDSRAKATIDISNIGRVQVEPGTRIGLVSSRPGEHRLQLARGTMHAFIWAPPGQFFVSTPSSTAVDLGCAYTLTVDSDGAGRVRVTTGWVGFEWRGREAFVPAGAVCLTRPGIGPGTPHFEDTSAEFQAALKTLDLQLGTQQERRGALDVILNEARPKDMFTLWHLLTRVDADERDRVFYRLAKAVPPPAGVTLAGVRAGRRDMLDEWWDTLGLGSTNWWRVWKQQWRDSAGR